MERNLFSFKSLHATSNSDSLSNKTRKIENPVLDNVKEKTHRCYMTKTFQNVYTQNLMTFKTH